MMTTDDLNQKYKVKLDLKTNDPLINILAQKNKSKKYMHYTFGDLNLTIGMHLCLQDCLSL